MASSSETWNYTFKSNLLKILRVQKIFVFAGVLLYAFLAVLQIYISFSFLTVCVLVIANLNFALQAASGSLYGRRPFPWNWVIFLAILILLTYLSVLASVVLLRWMVTQEKPFWEQFHQTWRIGAVICMGSGILGFAGAEVRRKLQEKNALLEQVNEFVCGNVAPGKFITFFYAILDARNHTLTYENAGHCAGLLMKATGETEQLRGQGGVLGVQPEWTYADSTLALASGDRLLFFTDGVTEAENAKEEEFGYQGIAKAAGTGASFAAELKSKIMKAVEEFCRNEFRDDVTLVVACIQ